MIFRNLQIYRLPAPWAVDLAALEEQLARKRFQPCGSQDFDSRGWATPGNADRLVHAVGGQWLIALGLETKLLPAGVVRQVADEKAAAIEAEQGYKPGRKQMKELREQVTQELLPRAFPRRSRMLAWIDPLNGWLVVDAPSPARAEDLLETLRQSLDSFPLQLLRTEIAPASAMASWLAAGVATAGFTIDRDCELHAITEDKASVRYAHHTLEGEEVKAHLAAGKLPTRLAMTFADRISFVLTEKAEIRRLAFLDVVQERLEEYSQESAQDLFDGQFAIMTGELQRLIPAVVAALGGELEG
jgi:recombination associated protein RdgC